MSNEHASSEKQTPKRNGWKAYQTIKKISLSIEIFFSVIAGIALVPFCIFIVSEFIGVGSISQNQFNLFILLMICANSYRANAWIDGLDARNESKPNNTNEKTE